MNQCDGILSPWKPSGTFGGFAVLLLAVSAIGGGVPGTAAAQETVSGGGMGEGPALLSQVVGVALERNRDVRDAEYQLSLAEARVTEAWSSVYPTVSLSSSFVRNIAPQVSFLPAQIFDPSAAQGEFIPVQFGADNIWNLSINAEQPLFEPEVFVGVGAAAGFRGLQREILRERTQQAVTRVRIAFYGLLLAQEEVRLTENSLLRVRQALEETKAMNEAGLAQTYDVLRLQVELANLEPELGRAQNRRTAARRTLAAELDLDPESELEVAGALARMDLNDLAANTPANQDILAFVGASAAEDADQAGFVRQWLADRSQVRQLEITEDLRRIELRIEQVAYLPSVFAFGTYGLAAQQNGAPDFFGSSDQRGSTKQIGLRVSFPIFSGFSRDARINQRRAALRQAEVQASAVADQAEVQIRNLVDQVREARARSGGQRLAVSQAQRGYAIASAQYSEGMGSRLERTDAEMALRQSEFNYAQAVYDYLTSRARLDEAVGQVPLVDTRSTGSGADRRGR